MAKYLLANAPHLAVRMHRVNSRRDLNRMRLIKYISKASLKELRYCANVIRYNKKYAKHKKSR